MTIIAHGRKGSLAYTFKLPAMQTTCQVSYSWTCVKQLLNTGRGDHFTHDDHLIQDDRHHMGVTKYNKKNAILCHNLALNVEKLAQKYYQYLFWEIKLD